MWYEFSVSASNLRIIISFLCRGIVIIIASGLRITLKNAIFPDSNADCVASQCFQCGLQSDAHRPE